MLLYGGAAYSDDLSDVNRTLKDIELNQRLMIIQTARRDNLKAYCKGFKDETDHWTRCPDADDMTGDSKTSMLRLCAKNLKAARQEQAELCN
jgi:hypothetical protein